MVKRSRRPRLSPYVPAEDTMGPMSLPSTDSRHLRRLLEGLLIEIRSTRQYVMWLHEMLANHELGKEADMPTRDTMESQMAKKRIAEEERLKRRMLTEDEQRRIASGEDVESVLDDL